MVIAATMNKAVVAIRLPTLLIHLFKHEKLSEYFFILFIIGPSGYRPLPKGERFAIAGIFQKTKISLPTGDAHRYCYRPGGACSFISYSLPMGVAHRQCYAPRWGLVRIVRYSRSLF